MSIKKNPLLVWRPKPIDPYPFLRDGARFEFSGPRPLMGPSFDNRGTDDLNISVKGDTVQHPQRDNILPTNLVYR